MESVQTEERVTRRGVRTPSILECTDSMDRCNELLPPFLLNGDLDVVSAHHLSPFLPDDDRDDLQCIEVVIEFGRLRRRSTMSTPRSVRKSGKESKSKSSSKCRGNEMSSNALIQHLPDLEPATMGSGPEVIGISEDDSVDIGCWNRKSMDIDIDDGVGAVTVSQSVSWRVRVDDLRLDLFLRSFPQLLTTHHLIHCHYVGNERECEYEWIQTDSSLMEIIHRFMAEHDGSTNDIALNFQIRPRSDTKSDEESIESAKQFVVDGLRRINDRVSMKRRIVSGDGVLMMEEEEENEWIKKVRSF